MIIILQNTLVSPSLLANLYGKREFRKQGRHISPKHDKTNGHAWTHGVMIVACLLISHDPIKSSGSPPMAIQREKSLFSRLQVSPFASLRHRIFNADCSRMRSRADGGYVRRSRSSL